MDSPIFKPAGAMRFSLYDQVIQATVGGQGVALGRIPLIAELLNDGRLIAPFPKRYDSPRSYFVIVAPHAAARPDVCAFVAWLVSAAAAKNVPPQGAPKVTKGIPAAKRSRAAKRKGGAA